MKYRVEYTLNGQTDYKTHVEQFSTKKQYAKWLRENKEKVYWHQLLENDPKSKKPKVVLDCSAEDLASRGYKKMPGVLETYFETGMECLGLILYKDGFEGGPNPNFDPSKPEGGSNFKNYKTHEGIEMIQNGDILQIDGTLYGIARDPDFSRADGFRLSVYPRGFSRMELLELFLPENKRAVLWRMEKKV